MKNEPLVSVVIPTYNSEKTLPTCLESIKRQTYRNVEIIVVDSFSKDRTVEIAREWGARAVLTHGGLLWARYIGHRYAKGAIELLLDSDQILQPTTIERGVRMVRRGYDMVILEESSYKPSTLTQWLFYIDRRYVHKIKDYNPLHGVLLARMYTREILDKAFESITHKLPVKLMYRLVSQDHALIYYEAWIRSKKLCMIDDAVYHVEPESPSSLIRKFYRYGKTELDLTRYYPELTKKRTPRKVNPHPEAFISLMLWSLKAIPYLIGRLSQYT
ncbi:MAG: hypothetical protein DRJ47_09685 [Thermoprotei archaeon]|nr:MAG: hypothetical protein DRJ47_09685 [Thermoprotei archaeon]